MCHETDKQQRKGKQTNTHARNSKINEENTNGNVQSVTSEADSFRNTKIKASYTLEDGHAGQNM
jgi:hypothetical protein